VGASNSVEASYRDAERLFNSLSFEERGNIQLSLIWAGSYSGLVDGELGRRTYKSIQAYQQSIGAAPTGALSRSQFDELIAEANLLMGEIGFDIVSDPETGLTLALPTALLSHSGPTRRGFRWVSPDDRSVEIETVAMPVAEQSYLQLYERLSRERPNRRVTYRTFEPSFFVVSGYIGTRKFYSRFQPGPLATRGFSLAWDPSLGPIMDRMAVAMSSLLVVDTSVAERPPAELTPDERASPEPEQRADGDISLGTGFFVSAAGHLVTNDHVVERCREAVVRLADGQASGARILARSSQDDLAILKAEMAPAAVAEFREGQPVRVGEEVVVFGFPLIGSLGTTGGVLTTGHVSALAGPGDHPGLLQMSAPVQSGNSGGPLLDQAGNVIGVVTWKTGLRPAGTDFEVLQNMNFAVKSSIVTNMLDAHGVPYGTGPSGIAKATTDIADAARRFAALVICR
jgi:S1-C subfamily serine protease